MDKVVVLARGLGTRMRRGAESTPGLTEAQAAVACAGIKALMPIHQKPFLNYGLSRLAAAGFRRVCLVIGPLHTPMRKYFGTVPTAKLQIRFAVQEHARGTADAVVAAEAFVGDDPFAVVNGDNLYPVEALRALQDLDGPGLIGFDRDALVGDSNIDPERIAAFAVIDRHADGTLADIEEKPDPVALAGRAPPIRVSMNAWRFDPGIVDSLHAITPSRRGELEIPHAVRHAIATRGTRFQVVDIAAGVLDLTGPADVAEVERRLAGEKVEL